MKKPSLLTKTYIYIYKLLTEYIYEKTKNISSYEHPEFSINTYRSCQSLALRVRKTRVQGKLDQSSSQKSPYYPLIIEGGY